MPVVLNLHGLTSNIDQQVALTQFEALAATEGFVVVTPQGLGTPARWGFKNDPQNEDLPFFNALLDQVEAQWCVDTARVYSSGLSNGGMMSTTLACQMGDRIAAVGLVSGIRQPDGCTPPGTATPMMVFWGTKDAVLPYDGGLGAGLIRVLGLPAPSPSDAPSTQNYGFPPVEQVVAEWAAHDGCGAAPTVFPVGTEVEERVYSGCTNGVEVRFYVVADGGHNWPGSKVMLGLDRSNTLFGITTDQVDATALIWKFFRGYALSA
jgi:polyhydroxybutyrate depolymerase